MTTDRAKVHRGRRVPRATGREGMAKPLATPLDVRVVDAAFADLETTALRSDNPPAPLMADYMSPSYQGLTRQLSAQLRLLDEQRQRLTKLLRDLRSSPPIEG